MRIGVVQHLILTTVMIVVVTLREENRVISKSVKFFKTFFQFTEERLSNLLLVLLEPRIYFYSRDQGVIVLIEFCEKLIQ